MEKIFAAAHQRPNKNKCISNMPRGQVSTVSKKQGGLDLEQANRPGQGRSEPKKPCGADPKQAKKQESIAALQAKKAEELRKKVLNKDINIKALKPGSLAGAHYTSLIRSLPLVTIEKKPEPRYPIQTTIDPKACDSTIIRKETPLLSPKGQYEHSADNPYTNEYWRKQLIDTIRRAKREGRVDLLEHLVNQAYEDNNVLIALVKKIVPDKSEVNGSLDFRAALLADFEKRKEALQKNV